jgi:uncharacterized SAM-binding protein YcdF (DUF218 family)
VVPPPNLVLAAIAGLLLIHRHRRAGSIVVACSLGLLLILALPITGQVLLVSLELGLPLEPPRDDPPQAIVILGAEVEHTPGKAPHDVQIGALSLQRLRAGAELQRRAHLPVLVSGGVLEKKDPPIAELMAASLKQDFGVQPQWVEGRSRNTWENARDSAAILEPLGIHSVYIVTHAWHEHRAMIAFRRVDMRVTAAPVQFDGLSSGVLPSVEGWTHSYFALHEWIGFAWYWLADHLWRSNNPA